MRKTRKNDRGFTLAELLIVVAIIAVLVAISIPIFSTQLEKSREATDLANVRSAYAKVRTAAVTGSPDSSDVTESENLFSISVNLKQKKTDWQSNGELNIGGIKKGDSDWQGTPKENGICTITCSKADGKTVINWNGGTYLASAGISATLYQTIMKVTNSNYYDSNAPKLNSSGQPTGTEKIREALASSGLDMGAMGVATWQAHRNGNNLLFYVTPVDITKSSKNTQIPVIQMKIDSNGNVTGYFVGTKKVTDSAGNSSFNKEDCYNYLDQNSFSGTSYANYNDAVTALNQKLKDAGFSDTMNTMPE